MLCPDGRGALRRNLRKRQGQRSPDHRPSAAARGYGSRWQKARARFLASHPLCVTCQAAGRVVAATVVDHKIPHRGDQDIFWQVSNWQSLCQYCHNKKSARGQ